MNYLKIEQRSPEWWNYKCGKISGTRFGQLISDRENTLVEELADEILNGHCTQSDFENEDIIFGIENEDIAISKYEAISGLKFIRGGVMQSILFDNHIASPDAITNDKKIVLEVKCTMHGATHLKRFLKGIDSVYKNQVINYFAVSDDVEEVHWISYCPFRPEREIIAIIFKRDTILETKEFKTKPTEIITIQDKVVEGRFRLNGIKESVNNLISEFIKIDF